MKITMVPVVIEVVTLEDSAVTALGIEQEAELVARYDGTETALGLPLVVDPAIEFLVAREAGEAVGCIGLQPLEPAVGEIKRLYVRPGHRGDRLARLLLSAVEALARERGYASLRLATGDLLPEAIGLYTASGYRRIPLFGPYARCPRSLCYEKML